MIEAIVRVWRCRYVSHDDGSIDPYCISVYVIPPLEIQPLTSSSIVLTLYPQLKSSIFVTMARERKAKPDLVSRDYTIHLAKYTHKTTFKSKTPRAVKKIKEFAQKAMGTKDVRLDVDVNKFVWSQGVRNPPKRIRVRLSRKRNEDEDADEKLYTYVQLVKVPSVKGLQTEVVDTA